MKKTENQILAEKTLAELKRTNHKVSITEKGYLIVIPIVDIPSKTLVDFAMCAAEIKQLIKG